LAGAADPEVLSLSLGLPDPELFPVDAFAEASARALGRHRNVLQYGLPCERLKRQICAHMAQRGVDCSPDRIFLTGGAQQGMHLLAGLLLDRRSAVLEEELTYPGFQQAIDRYDPDIITIPCTTREGLVVEAVERAFARVPRPALLYIMTDGHNPLGVSLDLEKRRRLALLAREYHVPICEDDAYGFLCYEEARLPPVRAAEDEWVYYIGSFAKVLAPSLRVGWLVVPPDLMRPLSVLKEAWDINTSSYTQWMLAEYLDTGALPAHIQSLCVAYRAKRDAMHAALCAAMPPGCRWTLPSNGVFVWIDLPDGVDASALLNEAIQRERVAFLPAEAFSRGRRRNGMRLNFSHCTIAEIAEAVARIGRMLRFAMA